MIESHCRYALIAGARPRTLQVRARVLRHFDREHGLVAATREDVLTFLARDLSAQSRASYLLHLRAFYRWAVDEQLLADDPTARVPRPRVPIGQPRPVANETLALALTTAHEPLRSWFLLAAYAGLRACEIAPLRGDDLRDGALFIRETKGGGSRIVVANTLVQQCIRAVGTDGPLWDVPEYKVSARCNDWLHRRGSTSTLHAFRHWAGTGVLRTSLGNVRIAQEFLGHASLTSTMVYTRVDPVDVRAAVEALPLPA